MWRRLTEWLASPFATPSAGEEVHPQLLRTVAASMPDSDATTVHIAAAVAGLLACVAYADRQLAPAEEHFVRAQLLRIDGMAREGVDAIFNCLRGNLVDISSTQLVPSARALTALTARGVRLELLSVLVDLAAADGHITVPESNLLRTATQALGLTQQEYNEAQSRHRDKIAVLQK